MYNFKDIEKKWQERWEKDPYFAIEKNSGKPAFYCLDMFPYPSGSGLHVGHWKGYVISDLFARQKYLQGYNVLHPMGWDAFGLPAENDAIKKGLHPEPNTAKNIANFKQQLRKIGAIYDWSCELNTTDPNYYKWTQWIFLQMFKNGLAYQEEVAVNWCPSCLTGLANEEASAGECERCGSKVEQRPLRQWILKITKYADALDDDLDLLDWPNKVKIMQRHWIGRSQGSNIYFEVAGAATKLTVFTTRADTLGGCTFLALADSHELASQLITRSQAASVAAYLKKSKFLTDMDRQLDKNKDGVFTGSYAINPLTGQEIPIFLANYVLKHYGTGAVMGVPAHDQRDFEFAQKFGLAVRLVISPKQEVAGLFDADGRLTKAYQDEGVLVNTGDFDGLAAPGEAMAAIIDHLAALGKAEKIFCYKLRDWIFSRQRYWGEPIPLVHCAKCGVVPLPESSLPLMLPVIEKYEPTGTGESPLAGIDSWVNTQCPACSGPAKRETNTMPQWAGSCWYFLRYPSVNYHQGLADPKALDYWMPVDLYVGGVEHAVLHLLYARFFTKFLYDIEVVPFKEPFTKLFNQGMVCMRSPISGRVEKMSKSKGNVVNPDDIVESLGSDCLRMYILFMGPPELDTEWQTESIRGVHTFLNRLWAFLTDKSNCIDGVAQMPSQKRFHAFLQDFTLRLSDYKVNTAVSSIMEYLNDLTKHQLKLDPNILRDLLVAISVMVPHFAAELLETLLGLSLADQSWPAFDAELAAKDTLDLPVQVNGKLRGVINVIRDEDEEKVVNLAKDAVQKWLSANYKTIVVKNRLVNFVNLQQ